MTIRSLLAFCLTILIFSSAATSEIRAEETSLPLSLDQAVALAAARDPWLTGNRHSQDALTAQSIAAGSLPDPTISLDMANLPTNNFDFGQEAMTQLRLGVTQAFPAGDSRRLRREQLARQGDQLPHQRADRRALIRVTVGQLWLDAFRARETAAILTRNRGLFEQLADLAEASYSSASGQNRQQNIIRAEVELSLLEDRLTQLRQKEDMMEEALRQWLMQDMSAAQAQPLTLMPQLAEIPLQHPDLYTAATPVAPQALFNHLATHPALRALDQKIAAQHLGIDLAEQKYKPEWALKAGYGHRSRSPIGQDRPDLFSLGVTVSVPLFTANRQDKEVSAAKSRTAAVKTEKSQLLRKMMAGFASTKAQLQRLQQRQTLYRARLLPELRQQAEAAQSAYIHDGGDFSDVVRARIAEMNADIILLDLKISRQKTILQLNYYFAGDSAAPEGDMP